MSVGAIGTNRHGTPCGRIICGLDLLCLGRFDQTLRLKCLSPLSTRSDTILDGRFRCGLCRNAIDYFLLHLLGDINPAKDAWERLTEAVGLGALAELIVGH